MSNGIAISISAADMMRGDKMVRSNFSERSDDRIIADRTDRTGYFLR